MNRRGASWWVERALFTTGLVLVMWVLLAAAQRQFYASLPPPQAPSAPAVLPGEGPQTGPARHGATVPAAARGADRAVASRLPAPGEWLARLEAPAVGLTATVIEGSTDQMLARAAGHIEDTALPGEAGNVGIAGHRDTTFRAVRHLKVGDRLTLTTTAGTFTYRIERTFVVEPADVEVLDPTVEPSLTLVTCYPFTFIGHAPKRYIVRAVLAGRN